ncbi:MAG: amino acid permease [Candidatus Omnitrophica bacterium]|nr:amino acid permease [Candidatus Omnitrophota bacterium]
MDKKGNLSKSLGLIHVFAVASGAMISSGLFVIPGLAHAMAGPGVVWSYLLAGILAATGVLSIAELTTAMPKAGGDYFFIMRSFGPGVGSIAGILSWFSLSLKSAFAVVGMATFISLVTNIHGLLAGAILCFIFVIINLAGIHQAARAQIFLVAGIFGLLTVYIAASLPHLQLELVKPFIPHGWGKVFATTGFVFISYGGLLKVAGIAEEVRNPGRTITLGMILSLAVTAIFYTAVVLVTTGILPAEKLDGSLTPISDGGRVIFGRAGFIAMSIGAILAFTSTANAGIMSASRYLLALSRDKLLPKKLSQINSKFDTPHIAIITTGAIILLSLFLPLKLLVEAASTVLILTFIMSSFSVIILRQSKVHNYRPKFRSPLYPWIQIAGIIGFGFLLFKMNWHVHLISVGLIVVGFLIFWFYGRRFAKQEFALLHIIEDLTDKKLVTGSLEQELKGIIRERDQLVLDRIDHLVEDALVLDLDKHLKADQFFQIAAEKLSPYLKTDKEELAKMLKKREESSSTVLDESLAVPHVVIPGEKKFQLLLARARKGVEFSEQFTNITTIFVIIGTADERSFHLRVLAAIAQVFQAKEFEKHWMEATNKQGLRDLILLSERKRDKKR